VRYPSASSDLPEAELLSIAVAAPYRSHGLGADLVAAIGRSFADRGVREFKVVVGADNAGANRFYERLAARPPVRTSVHDGAASNVWVVACPS
jgi:ribosomal protein S18 acetylase RimI-like enzyme